MPFIPPKKKLKTGNPTVDALVNFLGINDNDPASSVMDAVTPLAAVRMPVNRAMKYGVDWVDEWVMREMGYPKKGIGFGPPKGGGKITMNRDAWKKLDNTQRKNVLRHEEGHGVLDNDLDTKDVQQLKDSFDKRLVFEEGDYKPYHNWYDSRIAGNDLYDHIDDAFPEWFADMFAYSHDLDNVPKNYRSMLDNPELENVLKKLLKID